MSNAKHTPMDAAAVADEKENVIKYDIITGINFPHRLASGKTSEEVDAWCSANNHVRLNRDRKIGRYIAEAIVVPRMVFDFRPDECDEIARAAVADTNWKEQSEANARLIAAAPETAAERDRLKEINSELLAALEKAKKVLGEISFADKPDGNTRLSIGEAYDNALAAIAKTRG